MGLEESNLPRYERRLIAEQYDNSDGTLDTCVLLPSSISWPTLSHISPSDITLGTMQVAYLCIGSQLTDLPENWQYNALLLRYKAQYINQDLKRLNIKSRVHKRRKGRESDLAIIKLEDPNIFLGEMTVGVFQHMNNGGVVEELFPLGHQISPSLVKEALDFYNGEQQSDVVALGQIGEGKYEAAIKFSQYSEIKDLAHISAKQMLEALMKASLCAAADQAYKGNCPLSYEDFMLNRPLFRTDNHDISFTKLLKAGSQSLLRFSLRFERNKCIVDFCRGDKEEDVFATGNMIFYHSK